MGLIRKRRYTASQRIVGLATVGMPRPVRAVLGTRILSTLLVIVTPLLLATGILSFEWDGLRPRFAFQRDRAQQLQHEATDAMDQMGVRFEVPAAANQFFNPGQPDGGWQHRAAIPAQYGGQQHGETQPGVPYGTAQQYPAAQPAPARHDAPPYAVPQFSAPRYAAPQYTVPPPGTGQYAPGAYQQPASGSAAAPAPRPATIPWSNLPRWDNRTGR
jgi:hypothetical protein